MWPGPNRRRRNIISIAKRLTYLSIEILQLSYEEIWGEHFGLIEERIRIHFSLEDMLER